MPKPHLVQYENRPRNETEPFNLQERVLPHSTDDTGLSGGHPSHLTAKLLAAEEGHHPTSKGKADHAQGSDSHVCSDSHDQHPGPVSQIDRFSLGPNEGGSKRGRDGSRGGRDSS